MPLGSPRSPEKTENEWDIPTAGLYTGDVTS